MSVTTSKDVFCDICGDWVTGDIETTNKKVRKLVRRDGWKYKKIDGEMKDVCPMCTGGVEQ